MAVCFSTVGLSPVQTWCFLSTYNICMWEAFSNSVIHSNLVFSGGGVLLVVVGGQSDGTKYCLL